jgi:hypothetical protein
VSVFALLSLQSRSYKVDTIASVCSIGRSKQTDQNFSFLKDNPPAKELNKEGEKLDD